MAQYSYKGQVLVKNSRREDYEYACITECNDGKIVKHQISSTYDGAGAEKRRRISGCRESIENYKRAIRAFENGKEYYTSQRGRCSERHSVTWYKGSVWIPEEEKKMNPVDFYNHLIEETKEDIEMYEKNWIIVKVEKA